MSSPLTAAATPAALVLGLLGLAAACRDAPELFEPPALEPLGPAPYRLTFATGREIEPTWSASGDSVLYVTEVLVPPSPPPGSPDTLREGGPLRVIPRAGGVATRVLPVLQTSERRTVPIDFAVQSGDERVAAFTLLPTLDPELCGGTTADCTAELPPGDPLPRLSAGLLRVRRPGAGSAPEGDPQLLVEFPGRTFDQSQHPSGLDGVWQVDLHPFQRRFDATRRAPTHVSWAPGGDRLAYSDGVSLHVWNPDTGATSTIPGSDDGVDPAWSPDGAWIAFERLERGSVTEATCEHRRVPAPGDMTPGTLVCVEQRRTWPLVGHTLALVRPDGSELRVLTPGSRPAWGPDGDRLYYELQGRIWSVAIDGSDARVVPNTENGFMPAPSPDGKDLAFARFDPLTALSDIWIVSLEE